MQANPLLVPDKLPKPGSYGRARRAYNRAKKKHYIHIQTIELIEEYLPEFIHIPVEIDGYDSHMYQLLDAIDNRSAKPNDRHMARWYVGTLIERGNKEGYWELDPPPMLIKVRRHRQMRTIAWDNAASKASQLRQDFESALNSFEKFDELSSEEILALIILTASFYGGLNDENSVTQLVRALQEDIPIMQANIIGQRFLWFDLIYNDKRIHNIIDDELPRRYTRWFPDTHSLGLIKRYQEFKSDCPDITASSKFLFKTLKSSLAKLEIQMPFSTINAMCMASVSMVESQPAVALSSALVETLNGRNLSVSLTPEYWDPIISDMEYSPVGLSYADYANSFSRRYKNKQRQKGSKPPHISAIYGMLSEALAQFDSTRRIRTGDEVSTALKDINTVNWPAMAQYLRDYYIFHLDIKKNTPSTALRYHNAIANALLIEDAKFQLGAYSPEDLFLIYKQMVDERVSTNSRHYMAGCLDAFQHFAETQCDFPIIVGKVADGEKSTPMVRAGYINKRLYQATLKSIQNTEGLDQVTRQGLAVLFVVAYRSGLRLQELIKLKLCDFEVSDEYWLFVKSNEFGSNKRSAMPRKIPLACLLTSSELELWKEYLGKRFQFSNNDGELLFCHDGLGIIPLDPLMVSRLISNALRLVSGINTLTFHHLRHTALSNLHIIAEREWELSAFLTGYSREQIKNIIFSVFGNENETLRVYWGLAVFAGHNSPQTTLQSYLHFTSLITHLKCIQNTTTYNITQCKSLSSLTSNMLTRIINRSDISLDDIPVEILREAIIRNLNVAQMPGVEKLSKQMIYDYQDDDPETFSMKRVIHPNQAHEILSNYIDKGYTVPELVYRYNVSEQRILQWIENMKSLASLQTKKGKTRLVLLGKKAEGTFETLPNKPKSRVEELDSYNIIEALSNKVRKRQYREDVFWILNYYVTHATRSASGILFKTVNDLDHFLNILTPEIIPAKRWLLVIRTGDEWSTEQIIETRYDKSTEDRRNKARTASAYLHLRHPDETDYVDYKNNEFKKYSACTLRYTFHMAAIMSLDSIK